MENTLENKAKFFAHYWGQQVIIYPDHSLQSVSQKTIHEAILNNFSLELKPISMIGKIEAIELIRLKLISKSDEIKSIRVESKTLDGFTFIVKYKNFADNREGFIFNGQTNPVSFYDYIRLKGYAIPWMVLSVEKQIEYGWIKLKTD